MFLRTTGRPGFRTAAASTSHRLWQVDCSAAAVAVAVVTGGSRGYGAALEPLDSCNCFSQGEAYGQGRDLFNQENAQTRAALRFTEEEVHSSCTHS